MAGPTNRASATVVSIAPPRGRVAADGAAPRRPTASAGRRERAVRRQADGLLASSPENTTARVRRRTRERPGEPPRDRYTEPADCTKTLPWCKSAAVSCRRLGSTTTARQCGPPPRRPPCRRIHGHHRDHHRD